MTRAPERSEGPKPSATEVKDCYLLERTGARRVVWGPYTLSEAILEKGSLYVIIRGDGLRGGTSLSPGDVQAAYQSHRIWPAERGVESLA
jgi:hypothetical protein